ncbi:MAG TPA: YisL family protein [Pseudogracilibacillus sp.]|nr:YisL family protein [Pseudogracilibacillus sp.]
MAHLHITGWVLAFILLFIVTAFYKQGKEKPGKILHMILRLDYLLILYSGGSLLSNYIEFGAGSHLGELIIKIIAGLWAIIAMEMIGVRTSKGKATKGWWIQFVIVALIAIILGFGRLPYGILP